MKQVKIVLKSFDGMKWVPQIQKFVEVFLVNWRLDIYTVL